VFQEKIFFLIISRKITHFKRGLRLTFYLNELKMLDKNCLQILKADEICNFSCQNKLLFQNFPLPLNKGQSFSSLPLVLMQLEKLFQDSQNKRPLSGSKPCNGPNFGDSR